MKPTFRKSMIWLHTYSGLIFGWLLFVIFFTGTLSYYNTEITHWISGNSTSIQPNQKTLLLDAFNKLEKRAPLADAWAIQLPSTRGHSFRLSYRIGKELEHFYVNQETLKTYNPSKSQGGNFFRTFHYTLSMNKLGRYLAGIAAMIMLIGVFTGIYTHKRFFKDFFTIRTNADDKYLKDLHALLGIITLPFCLIISISALLIYINLYNPFATNHYFDNYRKLNAQVSTQYKKPIADQKERTTNIKLNKVWKILERHWGKELILTSVNIEHPAKINAQLLFKQQSNINLSNKSHSLAFEHSGKLLPPIEKERLARKIRRIFYGLHEAHFANNTTRLMLFTLGLAASILIASGMIVWLKKRSKGSQKKSFILVGKINTSVLYGLPLAAIFYFLACRVPWEISISLQDFEKKMFFISWLITFITCLILKEKTSKLIVFSISALLLASLFLLDILTKKGAFAQAYQKQDNVYLYISLFIICTAMYYFYASYKAWLRYKHVER